MLEAVIFDFDGVLVDTPAYYFKHMREYLKKLNTHVSDEDISHLVGLTFAKKLEYINQKYGLSVQREPFVKETSSAMMAEMEKNLLLDEFLGNLLDALRDSKIPIAIASNNSHANIDFFLKKLGIHSRFSAIIAYEDVSSHKPDKETYELAAKSMGAKPAGCVAIEDTVIGVESAKAAGLKCIAIPNKFTVGHNFSGADVVAGSFSSIGVPMLRRLVE